MTAAQAIFENEEVGMVNDEKKKSKRRRVNET
jgi:hypothetical protein